jgi:formamidopyrimidine-DNA glycosylase
MPELPEVETIRRILSKEVTGLTIVDVNVIYKRLIQTDLSQFQTGIKGKKILSLGRAGKYLIFHLSGEMALIVHFRMEGKFFHLKELEPNLNKHVSLYFTMDDKSYMIFNDVRKFGVMYYLPEKGLRETKPLNELGLEPWDIKSPQYLLDKYKGKSYMMKEALLDQSVITGLGNIYADEVLYASKISPFKKAEDLTLEEAKDVIANADRILKEAIVKGGSTIRTYHPAAGVSGNMQTSLHAYGQEGKECETCRHIMEKRYVGGRGTTYCPYCQHVCPSIAVTGKIAVGKSMVLKAFHDADCYTASADDMVHALYVNEAFLKKLEAKFPDLFENGALNKHLISSQMLTDKKFRRSFEVFVWSAVRDEINDFLINHSDKIAVVEVPLLFDAKMEKDFTYSVGVESDKEKNLLEGRDGEEISQKLELNKKTSYDLNRSKLDFIIHNDSSLEDLIKQTEDTLKQIDKRFYGAC